MPPYGWYPQPDRNTITGFWDGQRWLIYLTNEHLFMNGERIALDEIRAVSYWHRSLYGVSRHYPVAWSTIFRGFSVIDMHGRPNTLDLRGSGLINAPQNELAWTGLVDISQRFIEPRISQRILGSLMAGDEYTLNDKWTFLRLSSNGFTIRFMRTKSRPWTQFHHAAVNLRYDNVGGALRGNDGQVWIHVISPTNPRPRGVFALKTRVPNAVLLPTLMPMCAAAFR
ncbi:hypothetical protein MSM1_06680 [Mycobacterium sp. SM1]|uniref:hypothetical protein n=1 Tax=Mycobacterium sp. SM1 TaxID=2816243 RepID=UPI001BCDF3C7|nr:hypothetical protein [Mycobacterium sp. SM1]MBS4728048.1 hypothetical protein [Mycobacterium sp. SM1]